MPVKINRRSKIYALIETSGRQFKVSPGQTITVDKIPVAEGSQIEMDKVLLISDEGKITSGRPFIEGAKVTATVVGEGRGKKVVVFKFKSKTRYRKKMGHRQQYTKLTIKDIVTTSAGNQGEVIQDGA